MQKFTGSVFAEFKSKSSISFTENYKINDVKEVDEGKIHISGKMAFPKGFDQNITQDTTFYISLNEKDLEWQFDFRDATGGSLESKKLIFEQTDEEYDDDGNSHLYTISKLVVSWDKKHKYFKFDYVVNTGIDESVYARDIIYDYADGLNPPLKFSDTFGVKLEDPGWEIYAGEEEISDFIEKEIPVSFKSSVKAKYDDDYNLIGSASVKGSGSIK